MVDRLKVETILSRRFPGASDRQIADAANALMGLGDEWEEVVNQQAGERGSFVPSAIYHSGQADGWSRFRLFRRREL
jgi:hypothetical protein